MLAAVLCLQSTDIVVGFVGDAVPFAKIPTPQLFPLKDVLLERVRLHGMLALALDSLGVDLKRIHVVITEPPLMPLRVKSIVAEVLLEHMRVHSFAFLPQSVCCVVGCGLRHATILLDSFQDPEDTQGYTMVVPVYDCRELTPHIVVTSRGGGQSTDEDDLSLQDAIARIHSRMDLNVRAEVSSRILNGTESEFLGASVIISEKSAWPVQTRERWIPGHTRVFDALFDWPRQ